MSVFFFYIKLCMIVSPWKIRPPARLFKYDDVSRRGIKTPSLVSPFSVHSTAIRCAPFSDEIPTKFGSPFSLMCLSLIKQIPAIALPL